MASTRFITSPTSSDLNPRLSSDDDYDKDVKLTLSISSSSDFYPSRKSVDEVWGEIVGGNNNNNNNRECKVEIKDENFDMVTLEDFLAKSDAKESSVKVERMCSSSNDGMWFGTSGVIVEESSVRGNKRRLGELDKVAQQRQRRMIKNRESAARSRERKQAYQLELESMALKLEEENDLLLKEKEEQIKERFKELMEKIVPVVEKRKPQCALRRVCSTEW